MLDDFKHCGDVQIGEGHVSRSNGSTARKLYPSRRGWHDGAKRDRGGVRTLTPLGWLESCPVRDVEEGASLDEIDPRGLVS